MRKIKPAVYLGAAEIRAWENSRKRRRCSMDNAKQAFLTETASLPNYLMMRLWIKSAGG